MPPEEEGGDARTASARRCRLAAALALSALAGVRQRRGRRRRATLNWYVFNEPAASFDAAVADCNKQAGRPVQDQLVTLPTDADQQREQLVRRLAAKDNSIDIIGMDVIWTAEFAEAGWIKPWTGAEQAARSTQGTLARPAQDRDLQGQALGAPHLQHAAALVPQGPGRRRRPRTTWDEMIDDARRRRTARHVEVQARQYEGLIVWFNSLIASAGGQILDRRRQRDARTTPRETAAEIMQQARAARRRRRRAVAPNARTRRAWASSRARSRSWSTTRSSTRAPQENAPRIFQKNIGWAPLPGVDAGQAERAAARRHQLRRRRLHEAPDQAFAAAACLRNDAATR